MSDTAKRGSAEMRYLLGDLSEGEKTRLEEAFFADDAKFEELEVAEEELIDAYVRDYLSPEEQRKFQAKLLRSPRLVERVNFARVLAEKADSSFSLEAEDSIEPEFVVSLPEPKPRRSWWASLFPQRPAFGAAFATAGILLLIGGGILFYGWLRLRNESERLAAERAAIQRQKDELDKLSTKYQAEIEQLQADLKRLGNQPAPDQPRKEQEIERPREPHQSAFGAILHITLTTGSVRSEGSGNKVIIGPNHSSVQFNLPLETNNYGSYNVVIENIDKGVSIPRLRLKPQRTKSGHQLIFQIPARKLPAGTYIIKVTGRSPSGKLEPVTISQFSITRQ